MNPVQHNLTVSPDYVEVDSSLSDVMINLVIHAPTTTAISSSLGRVVVAFNGATRDLTIIKDIRSSELREVTAPYAFVLASVKVCNLSFVGSKVVEVYFLSIEMLGNRFMSFIMLSHSLLRSISKGSSHSIFDFHIASALRALNGL